jgi:hypothetical protein
MDWKEVTIKAVIGGIIAAGAALASTPVMFDWRWVAITAGGAFLLGAANAIKQAFEPQTVAATNATQGFWATVKKAL